MRDLPAAAETDAAEILPVVALGMSAGGLAACTALLEQLPIDTGAAVVVVQHLDPNHESRLRDLLGSATAMPVVVIQEGMRLAANRIHVLPPDVALAVADGVLHLQPREPRRPSMPIDGFLRSLAEDCGPAAIAVILSGTGADGALGVQAIRENGGIALAQVPADAAFDGMPLSAIATGCIDLVLPAAALGAEIARLVREHAGTAARSDADAAAVPADSDRLPELFSRLRGATGVDFSQYRSTTVGRRLRRRMILSGVSDLDAYLWHLDANPGELQGLAAALLISVTRFFRDREVFAALAQTIFPELIRRSSSGGVVRIWVAGCASGEEAYSLAITFVETAQRLHRDVTCQVFATDVNENVLERARRATYPENIVADVSSERLQRFFVPVADGYRIDSPIRKLCVFSRHDLLSDPPLPHMDLVSCRNLLIYLAGSHRQVFRRFHFALEPHSYLLLGRAESAASSSDLFEAADKENHAYRSRDLVSERPAQRAARDARRQTKWPAPIEPESIGAAYEELVAANEELQSLNEELESSREEIESVNVELLTLNEELRSRNLALQDAREFSEATLDTVPSALVVFGDDRRIVRANRSFCRMFRQSPGEVEGQWLADVAAEYLDDPRVTQLFDRVATGCSDRDDGEFAFEQTAGGRRVLAMTVKRVVPGDLRLLSIEDVTQIRQLEADRRQSQKMEAIGQMAAGVAHDFNNLLTVVLGGTQMVASQLPAESPLRPLVDDVEVAAQRAAGLTQQLLAYAGKARHLVESLDLSDIVIQTARLLHGSMPTHVQCRLDLDRTLPPLLADRSQMHQVVGNLMKNAVEAIGDGPGTLTVRTGQEAVARASVEGLDPGSWIAPGEYLFLDVQDTGMGMPLATQTRMFDPFFTTKFTGRGLGLAAVQGIVRQHSGTVRVTSVVGRGTSIRVLFACTAAPAAAATTPPAAPPLRGAETVMVVDDDALVLGTIQRALVAFGYEVLTASGGADAIELLRDHPRIGAVVLDATMPGMDGMETLRALRALRPELAVVLCSGAGNAAAEAMFAREGVVAFLHKPFRIQDLSVRLAQCFPDRAPRPLPPA